MTTSQPYSGPGPSGTIHMIPSMTISQVNCTSGPSAANTARQTMTTGKENREPGTSGTSNEVFVKTHDGSSLAERLRVGHTKTKVTGNLEVTGAQIDFTALPTSDPGVAGRLYRDGATVKVSL